MEPDHETLVCLAVALSIVTITVAAQSPPAPSFDVTSVKRNTSGGGAMQMRNMPGNVSAFNIPVRQLIRMAYQVQDFQIVGAPRLGKTPTASTSRGASIPHGSACRVRRSRAQRMSAMMKALLRDRFGMVAHTETREMPILALKLREAMGDWALRSSQPRWIVRPWADVDRSTDAAARRRTRRRGPIDGRAGVGLPPDGRGAPPPGAPFSLGERRSAAIEWDSGNCSPAAMPMARLATQVLSQLTGRIVVDRTGLTGTYDIDLKWSPTPDQLATGAATSWIRCCRQSIRTARRCTPRCRNSSDSNWRPSVGRWRCSSSTASSRRPRTEDNSRPPNFQLPNANAMPTRTSWELGGLGRLGWR